MYRAYTAVLEPGRSQPAPNLASSGDQVRGQDQGEAHDEGSHRHQHDPAATIRLASRAAFDRPQCLRARDLGDRERGAGVRERRHGPRLESLRNGGGRQRTDGASHARCRPAGALDPTSSGDRAGRRLRRRQRDRRRASALPGRACGRSVRLEAGRRSHRRARGPGRTQGARGRADAATGGSRLARPALCAVACGGPGRAGQDGGNRDRRGRRISDARRAGRRRTLRHVPVHGGLRSVASGGSRRRRDPRGSSPGNRRPGSEG